MSVINQMLKDLDKRSDQQTQSKGTVILPTKVHSPFKLIITTVIVMLLITISVFYVWSNYQRNQALEQKTVQQIDTLTINSREKAQQPLVVPPSSAQEKNSKEIDVNVTKTAREKVASQQLLKIESSIEELPTFKVAEKLILKEKTNHLSLHKVSVAEKDKISANTTNLNEDDISNKKSSLTISRKQLTPKALSKQKMIKAERAIAENNLAQAEQLFEEVLLIMPEHHVARQQLSALLFGRKLYQPAINLLQQGIVTAPKNHTFRLMKARIHLTLKQAEQAFDALSPLAHIRDTEYQVILSSTAQQINNFTAAIKSYLVLITIEPEQGRHWLGLAIAYDSNSEFIEASNAYQQAIQQGGLSNAASNFIQQRLAELGE